MVLQPGWPAVSERQNLWVELAIPRNGAELLDALEHGFPCAVLSRLAEVSGFHLRELAEIAGLSRYSLRQSQQVGRWTLSQSDRIFRVARVLEGAQALFGGNWGLARQWLTSRQRGLGGRIPATMLTTEIGAGFVLDLLGQLEHGCVP